MLSVLKIRNIAIIENAEIEYSKGFNVLTGETGAGKSLIIDAIGLLFGERSSTSIVRNGESKAIVEGVFENLSNNTKVILDEMGVESLEDDMLIIKREINLTGKSIVRVNGEIVTLNQLEKLASTLGDIHTQDDTKKLFQPENYLAFIDDENSLSILNEYLDFKKIYFQNIKKYKNLINSEEDITKNLEYWVYQLNELEKANLVVGELENLEEELDLLDNYEVIYKLLLEIKDSKEDGITAVDIAEGLLANTDNSWWDERTMIISFSTDVVNHVLEKYPDRYVAGMGYNMVPFLVGSILRVDALFNIKYQSIQTSMITKAGPISINCATQTFVDSAHKRNQCVAYWTINEKEDMEYLISLGADIITTNSPDLLAEVLGRLEE